MNSISMKKKAFLLIIVATCIITAITFFLTLYYVDPYFHIYLAFPVFLFSFIATITTFFTLVIYFFKKIYYRWEVYIYHIMTSFRQWFIIALYFLGIGFFISKWALNYSTLWLYTFLLVFIELFVWNIYKKQ